MQDPTSRYGRTTLIGMLSLHTVAGEDAMERALMGTCMTSMNRDTLTQEHCIVPARFSHHVYTYSTQLPFGASQCTAARQGWPRLSALHTYIDASFPLVHMSEGHIANLSTLRWRLMSCCSRVRRSSISCSCSGKLARKLAHACTAA